MTPERHARVKDVFVRAVARPVHERAEFVAQECQGDDAMKREVERLLSFHTEQTISPPANLPNPPSGEPKAQAIEKAPVAAAEGPAHHLNPGTVVANRFRIVSALGLGGMGVVYRAEDLVLRRPVALKFVRAPSALKPEWVRRLRREVRTALSITHPNVCRVFDIEDAGGQCFISMEYVDGETLASLLKRAGRLPPERVVEVATQICVGLAAAHEVGVVHRDLKPTNIMLDSRGNVRITDFGLSSVPADIPAAERIAGTPAYMAPEQFTGRGVSPRTDLYAFGLVLYEMACGRPAFSAENFSEYAKLQLSGQPASPSTLAADLDPRVERVIQQCLEKSPNDRPDSALDVAAALPGADALALALAARTTPNARTVAAARPRTLRQGQVAAVFVGTIGMIAALILLRRAAPMAWESAASKPPSVLAAAARTLLEETGYSQLANNTAHGFADIAELGKALGPSAPILRPVDGANSTPAFWYRVGRTPLNPQSALSFLFFRGARVTASDPPLWQPGTAMVALDLTGRLVLLHATTEGWDELGSRSESVGGIWPALLEAARVERPAPQRPTPDDPRRVAWNGVDARSPLDPIEARGLSAGGRPVHFTAGHPGADRAYDDWLLGRFASDVALHALFGILIVLAIPWAWHNHRRHRTDPRGAWRLACVVFAVQIGTWLLRARWQIPFGDAVTNTLLAITAALGVSALAGVLYLALEPFARRHWPYPLITWTRLLAGRFRDPAVGQHVLLGAVLGVFLAALGAGERTLVRQAGWRESPPIVGRLLTESLVGGRTMIAGFAQVAPDAALRAMLWVLLLVAMRTGLRRSRIAAAVATLMIGVLLVPRGASPQTAGFVALLAAGICVGVASRFGVLTLAVGLLTLEVLTQTPICRWPGISELSDAALCGLLLVAFLATAGFLISRRDADSTPIVR